MPRELLENFTGMVIALRIVMRQRNQRFQIDSQHSLRGPASGEDAGPTFFANSEGWTREMSDGETIVADVLDTLNLFEDDVMEEEWEGRMPQGIPDDVFDDANSLEGVSDDDDDDSYNYCLPLPMSELEDEELVELCQPTALLERTLRGGQQVFRVRGAGNAFSSEMGQIRHHTFPLGKSYSQPSM